MIYIKLIDGVISGFYDSDIYLPDDSTLVEISKETHKDILENGFNFYDSETDSYILKDLLTDSEKKQIRINDIYASLDNIDKKSIRALREQNQTLIDEYESEAEILRTELRLLNGE